MTVKIDSERYEGLLDTETRVQVLIDKAKADKYMSMEDMYRILGYTSLADELAEKERKELEL